MSTVKNDKFEVYLNKAVKYLKKHRWPIDKRDDTTYELLYKEQPPLNALIMFVENSSSGERGYADFIHALGQSLFDIFDEELQDKGITYNQYLETEVNKRSKEDA